MATYRSQSTKLGRELMVSSPREFLDGEPLPFTESFNIIANADESRKESSRQETYEALRRAKNGRSD